MPDTHTHTIESGNARVSVEADDAHLAVSEAQRNWELNNGGVVSETVDEIAKRIAEQVAQYVLADTDLESMTVLTLSIMLQPIVAPELEALARRAEAAEREREEQRNAKDGAYLERNQCVAGLAALAITFGWKAGTARTAIEGWSEDWHGCVYIDLPTGQVSWHFHDSQAHLFSFLPAYDGKWDGHDTPQKYKRLSALAAFVPAAKEGTTEPRALWRKCSCGGDMYEWRHPFDPMQSDHVMRCVKCGATTPVSSVPGDGGK
jgi:hypothetical protein